MSRITFDITNALSAIAGAEGIDESSLADVMGRLTEYNKSLHESPYPFMRLPALKYQFGEMKSLAAAMETRNIKNLVILGIGGSSLGTQTIFDALLHPLHNMSGSFRKDRPRFFLLDNIDPHKINHIAEVVEAERAQTLLVVISKSGETAETISQFMIFKAILEKDEDYSDRVVLITDENKGLLNAIARREGYAVLNLPEGVGGRFSVLTPVGFFPSAVMGIDIDEIAKGARDMADHVRNEAPTKNMALTSAALFYLMERRGKKIHVMMPYCERLSGFADWFRQLEAESLGKGHGGPTPLKSIGVTDQHSQLQLYIDGPRDKFITFLYSPGGKRPIPDSFPYLPEELDYLSGKDLSDLFHAEFLGTTLSLSEAKVPNVSLTLDEVDGYALGALFFLYEMVIALLGRLYKVNAFDQPGVELGKIYSKAIMGKKGLESALGQAGKITEAEKTILSF